MPLFLDIHQHVDGLTAKAVAGAHQRDLEVQTKYGVKYLKYWFDEGSGKVFCLVEAPTKEAAAAANPAQFTGQKKTDAQKIRSALLDNRSRLPNTNR